MPLTITSSTGQVSGSDIIYRSGNHGQGFMVYVDYTKGAEDAIRLTFAFLNRGVHASDFYNNISLDASYLVSPYTLTIGATGRYRIPLPIATEEQQMKITLDHTGAGPDGTVAIEIIENL